MLQQSRNSYLTTGQKLQTELRKRFIPFKYHMVGCIVCIFANFVGDMTSSLDSDNIHEGFYSKTL